MTTTIIGAFLCTDVDPDNILPVGSESTFLSKDLSISCSSSRYWFGFVWACVMIGVYPVGVLLLYWHLLHVNRDAIKGRQLEEEQMKMEESKREQNKNNESVVEEKQGDLDDDRSEDTKMDAVALVALNHTSEREEDNESAKLATSDIESASGFGDKKNRPDPRKFFISHEDILFLYAGYEGRVWYW